MGYTIFLKKQHAMFENITPLTADPILGLMAEFREDKRNLKIRSWSRSLSR